jgi:DNA polymerase-3 subunit epsilon
MPTPTQFDWLDSQQSPKLSAGFPDKMVLLDCETTGGRASYHRITEIGLLVIEDGLVIERWQSLVNPERAIPAGITRLTGITQDMVNSAPTFDEIADELLAKLNGRVLVAHHARFDYGFLKREFERAGINYQDKPLCSVKFSRVLYPQYKRHGLDHIIRRFGLQIDQRHRALDDALMIFGFFVKSSQIFQSAEIKAVCQQLLKEHTLPSQIRQADINQLPKAAGVYYFYDAKDVLLYVGKSVNIRQRVLSHFSQDHKNHKDLKMSTSIARIEFDQTVTDLGAQILESNQVKRLRPIYNSRLRRVRKLFRITTATHPSGFRYPMIKPVDIEDSDHIVQDSYGLFRSPRHAQKRLQKLADQYFLCHQVLGIETGQVETAQPCFRYQLKKCLGVCCGEEAYQTHNERLEKALQGYHQKVWPWSGAVLVEERGVEDGYQQQFHLIDQWIYLKSIDSEEQLMDSGYVLDKGVNKAAGSNLSNDLPATDRTDQFDLDIYFILVRFLLDPEKLKINHIRVHRLSKQTVDSMG